MNSETIKRLSQKLNEEKRVLLKQIGDIEDTGIAKAMGEATSELSLYDNHPADVGTEVFERSKDVALRDNANLLLDKVENALKRISEGSYGRCRRCGAEIPVERLEALPWADHCMTCASQEVQEDNFTRPIEEDTLKPPFQRSFTDESKVRFVGFDGEDTLQAVMKYGSSDTPQDIPGSYDYKALFPNSNEHQGIVERSDAIPNPEPKKDKRGRNA